MREAASLVIIPELIEMGAHVKAYDPIAIDNAKKILPNTIEYVNEVIEAIKDTEIVFILTEWDEIKSIPLETFGIEMKDPNIYDGRNCFGIEAVKNSDINYFSVGREAIKRSSVRV